MNLTDAILHESHRRHFTSHDVRSAAGGESILKRARVSCRPVFFFGGGGRLPPPTPRGPRPPPQVLQKKISYWTEPPQHFLLQKIPAGLLSYDLLPLGLFCRALAGISYGLSIREPPPSPSTAPPKGCEGEILQEILRAMGQSERNPSHLLIKFLLAPYKELNKQMTLCTYKDKWNGMIKAISV